ncbi:hypothetical protein EVB39_002 [Rhizobium phage RHph_TM3_3_9]|nr:hypothetical protein EVB39_002 [Rhizobium phage RHph_TM3_3_9]QIG67805.1 hypothetical protein EVB53_002 [Rhizobium phage RHph_Y60]QIG68524.1 hypothetical protein EVB66_002 [Rhizobium phage RHph_TM3_3_13]QIG74383.1 hypothetical protein EVC09_002 [Rhizobium phage RHph_TM3_3_10]QXV74495.1 hypothetical protein [Rhizobium phage RHEph19]
MPNLRIWDKDKCSTEAKKFATRLAFQKGNNRAYNAAYRHGWLDDICCHMRTRRHPNRYWTKTRCAREASQYKSRKAFERGSGSAYVVARRNGWLSEICEHMVFCGGLFLRYVYEIADHSARRVYIGLSYNPVTRQSSHRSTVRMNKDFPRGVNCKIIYGPASEQKAQEYEELFVAAYRDLGYCVTNRRETGGLGATSKRKYTLVKCEQAAKLFASKREFRKHRPAEYVAAYRSGWLTNICAHMEAR